VPGRQICPALSLMQTKPPLFRVPLLERLADDAPDRSGEMLPLRRYSKAEALASVGAELSRLLNTRRNAFPRLEQYSVIDYGIADWSGFKTGFEAEQRQLIRDIRQAITAFEPRLKNPQIAILPVSAQQSLLQITAELAGFAGSRAVLSIRQSPQGVSVEIADESINQDGYERFN
jgi:type VI secretion system lysozyme-related protein